MILHEILSFLENFWQFENTPKITTTSNLESQVQILFTVIVITKLSFRYDWVLKIKHLKFKKLHSFGRGFPPHILNLIRKPSHFSIQPNNRPLLRKIPVSAPEPYILQNLYVISICSKNSHQWQETNCFCQSFITVYPVWH